MEDLKKRLKSLETQFEAASSKIGLSKLAKELEELNTKIVQPNFWKDSELAQELVKRQASLKSRIEPWEQLKSELTEVKELTELEDKGLQRELSHQLGRLEAKYEKLAGELKFQGPYDDHDVILSIFAGAGGTDAQDWAEILLRMYSRYAESNQLKTEVVDVSAGEEAGIKSATLKLTGGDYLYGKLSGEQGVHRLVRLSPFNANNLRQTSFAKVEVLPLIEASDKVEIDEKDLKIDVFRAGGHGGQSVNTTDSAVRITHIPTGVTVAIQNERSQLQNKETALAILKSKLAALQLEQHAKTLAEIKGPNQSAEWGSQIRNYVLHPYKQVKDLRSGYETSEPQKVLGGYLEPVIEAWLAK